MNANKWTNKRLLDLIIGLLQDTSKLTKKPQIWSKIEFENWMAKQQGTTISACVSTGRATVSCNGTTMAIPTIKMKPIKPNTKTIQIVRLPRHVHSKEGCVGPQTTQTVLCALWNSDWPLARWLCCELLRKGPDSTYSHGPWHGNRMEWYGTLGPNIVYKSQCNFVINSLVLTVFVFTHFNYTGSWEICKVCYEGKEGLRITEVGLRVQVSYK